MVLGEPSCIPTSGRATSTVGSYTHAHFSSCPHESQIYDVWELQRSGPEVHYRLRGLISPPSLTFSCLHVNSTKQQIS